MKLPKKIEDIIFYEMKGIFNRDPSMVTKNLNSTEKGAQKYLGTYFPRSVVEAKRIITDLLSSVEILQTIYKKDTIKIIDIGSGAGGFVFGLIFGINAKITDKKYKIYAENNINIAYSLFDYSGCCRSIGGSTRTNFQRK